MDIKIYIFLVFLLNFLKTLFKCDVQFKEESYWLVLMKKKRIKIKCYRAFYFFCGNSYFSNVSKCIVKMCCNICFTIVVALCEEQCSIRILRGQCLYIRVKADRTKDNLRLSLIDTVQLHSAALPPPPPSTPNAHLTFSLTPQPSLK